MSRYRCLDDDARRGWHGKAAWEEDLESARNVSRNDKYGYGYVLHWYESWRMRGGYEADVHAARAFWKDQIIGGQREGKRREAWQLDQWTEAMRWYVAWLDFVGESVVGCP